MKHHLYVILILLIPLLAVVGYATLEDPVNVELTQIDLTSVDTLLHPTNDTIAAADTLTADTMAVDTTHQRILFVGDSMVGGIGPCMAKYAYANGHEFAYVSWVSSTTFAWSGDTLRNYIRRFDPTFIMISIGGNEQPARNLKHCEDNIRKIVDIVGEIPYVWICTPAWDKDAPFNFIPERVCGKKRFFDSRRLDLERGPDHHHPTPRGYSQWTDSVAVWLSDPQLTAHPIVLNPYPADTPSSHCTAINLKPNGKLNFAHMGDKPKSKPNGMDAPKPKKETSTTDATKAHGATNGKAEPAKDGTPHTPKTAEPQPAPVPQPVPQAQPVTPPPANHEGE